MEDRLLGSLCRDARRGGDLAMRQASQLAQQQRAALALGKLAKIGHQQGQAGPLLGAILYPGKSNGGLPDPVRNFAIALQRDCFLAGEAKQPLAHKPVALSSPQRDERSRKGRLQRVVGIVVVVQEQVAVRVQVRLISLVEGRECTLAPSRYQPLKPLVFKHCQSPRAATRW